MRINAPRTLTERLSQLAAWVDGYCVATVTHGTPMSRGVEAEAASLAEANVPPVPAPKTVRKVRAKRVDVDGRYSLTYGPDRERFVRAGEGLPTSTYACAVDAVCDSWPPNVDRDAKCWEFLALKVNPTEEYFEPAPVALLTREEFDELRQIYRTIPRSQGDADINAVNAKLAALLLERGAVLTDASVPIALHGMEWAMPVGFAEYIAREMPADTVIGDPAWWAPKFWRNAVYHVRAALSGGDK